MSDGAKNESKVPGGIARANSLTPQRRSDIARAGARAKWNKTPEATHKGNFKEHFGVDVECYVLDDPTKTAMISQTGMARTLGLAPRGQVFPRFIKSRTMSDFVGTELRSRIENPVKFQWETEKNGGTGRSGAVPDEINGFDAALLIDICNSIIAAEAAGKLKADRYQKVVRQAHIIVGATAKSGIKFLVYSLAGYNPSAEEVIAAFKLYVHEEAKKYEKEFPNELYAEWHRLYEIPVPDRGKPWHFKHLTIKHIYYPLAESNGKILALMRALKASDGTRSKKLFQFLNDLGARALRMHLGRVLEMCESSEDRITYERKIVERFGGQQELDLIFPDATS